MTAEDGLPDATLRAAAAERLAAVHDRIAAAAARAGRQPEEIRLVGVSKKQPLDRVVASVDAGLRILGQSYVQEARTARPALEHALVRAHGEAAPKLEWRMVGRLQRNKAALAARLFDAVESVDRPELADALDRRAANEGRALEVLIQVSLCDEPQKGGCLPEALEFVAERVIAASHLRLAGLMTVPAASPDPETARPTFAALRDLLPRLARLDPALAEGVLSMGMSADAHVAIEEGATLVRIGTALFGDRPPPAPAA